MIVVWSPEVERGARTERRAVLFVRRDTFIRHMVLHACNALGVDYDPRFAFIWCVPGETGRLLGPSWRVPWQGQGQSERLRLVVSDHEKCYSDLQDVFTIQVEDEVEGRREDIQVTPGTPVHLISKYFAAKTQERLPPCSVFFEGRKLPNHSRIADTTLKGEEGALVVLRPGSDSHSMTESDGDDEPPAPPFDDDEPPAPPFDDDEPPAPPSRDEPSPSPIWL